MNNLKTTNTLLLIIAIPVVFYVLKLLSFIFIPLSFSIFLAILFWPLIRWLKIKKVPKIISLIIVVIIMGLFVTIAVELIQLSSKEIVEADNRLFEKAETKLSELIIPIEKTFGITRDKGVGVSHYLEQFNFKTVFESVFSSAKNIVSMTLMTLFFTFLLLAESLNLHKLLNSTIIKKRFSSVRVFVRIEKDIITFIKVKFIISFFTGLGFTIACYFFDVSFPIFWGLLAFSLNFIQMIGSVVSVVLLSIFALIEINTTGTLLFFILTITLVQAIMGGMLEPIFMGKSFSINVITILVMLMFWGFIWGIPGLILSIPITVFLKIVFDQFPKTKLLSNMMGEH